MVKILNKQFTLYFVRHGETEYNVSNHMQGWCDSPLTKKGIQDLKNIKNEIDKLQINRAFSSPLTRAKRSCEILTDLSYEQCDILKEMHFGCMEATYEGTINDKEKKKKEIIDGYHKYGGESLNDLEERVKQSLVLFENIAEDNDNILIVTHGVFMMELISLFTHRIFDIHIKNGSIITIKYDNGYHLVGD